MSATPKPPDAPNGANTTTDARRPARRMELPPSTDVARAPRKKTKQYVYWAAGAVGVALLWYLTGRLRSDVPAIDRALQIVDTVQQGAFVRDVRASGTLAPEHVRIIAAVTAGRVEALPVPIGSTITRGTVFVELANPDVELQSLESQRGLVSAQATLAAQRTALETARLSQEGNLATVRAQYDDAKRKLTAIEILAKERFASGLDLSEARNRAKELEIRVRTEEKRLTLMTETIDRELKLQESQVERLRAIGSFQEGRIRSMRVVAPEDGILQTLPLQLGQYVLPGTELARVVRPGRLKAILRVSQADQRDVTVGQAVSIDTRTGGTDAIVKGRVSRIDPGAQNGTVSVEVTILDSMPAGARVDNAIDGTIELQRIPSTLVVTKPTGATEGGQFVVFKLSPNGKEATRTTVRFGRSGTTTIEVLNGLKAGDRIIVSDMAQYVSAPVVRIR